MSMEISRSYNPYNANFAKWARSEQKQPEPLDQKPAPQDEYVSSEKSAAKPMGLYRNGYFDDPKKADHRIREKCTTNTDKVDREIQKLKEVKQQLEQQIRSDFGNEKEIRELEKKLAQIESELSQKDHDTYRRQNAEISQWESKTCTLKITGDFEFLFLEPVWLLKYNKTVT